VIKVHNLRHIVMLESSPSHFLALKVKIRPAIDYWDPKTLARWLGENGFPEC